MTSVLELPDMHSTSRHIRSGKWGVSGAKEVNADAREQQKAKEIRTEFLSQVVSVEQAYHELLYKFMSALSLHPSGDLRFLRVRLDFNEFYDHMRKAAQRYMLLRRECMLVRTHQSRMMMDVAWQGPTSQGSCGVSTCSSTGTQCSTLLN